MSFKSIALIASTLFLSTGVNAATVTHNGYTLDTDTNIVTGGGIEWLNWTETSGSPVNAALALNPGWRLANNSEMAMLFNAFDFGLVFTEQTQGTQSVDFAWDVAEDSPALDFIELFGDNVNADGGVCCFESFDPVVWSRAWYGNDTDENSINQAWVMDDSTRTSMIGFGPTIGRASTTSNAIHQATPNIGVALVRDAPVVPVPAAVWLFVSGLIGLIGIARRKNA